jgi:hypothetical protein
MCLSLLLPLSFYGGKRFSALSSSFEDAQERASEENVVVFLGDGKKTGGIPRHLVPPVPACFALVFPGSDKKTRCSLATR